MASLVADHLNTPPPQPSITKPELPQPIDDVIATDMAKDPDHRYPTTVELANAAHDALTKPAAMATPAAKPRNPVPVTRKIATPAANINHAETPTRVAGHPPPPPIELSPNAIRRPGTVIAAAVIAFLLAALVAVSMVASGINAFSHSFYPLKLAAPVAFGGVVVFLIWGAVGALRGTHRFLAFTPLVLVLVYALLFLTGV
jgi:serine/threonine-protein kinase